MKFSESELVLGSILIQDIRLCQQDDPSLFLFMLPFIMSSHFVPAYMINNSELIYLIVSCVDSKQLKDLVAAIVSQDIVLLKQPEIPVKVKATNKKVAPGNKRKTKNSGPTSRGGTTNKSTSFNTGNKKRKRNSGISLFELKN